MIIAKFIFYVNIVAWLFPPFRQKGCKYFLFFLILALSDLIWYSFFQMHIHDAAYYLFISTLLIAAVMRKKYLLLLLIPVLSTGFFLTASEIRFLTMILHFAILIFFLREFILIISRESKIVLFDLVILLYEASLIFKFGASYFLTAGYLFFYITTAFEILIAVFFSFVNEKNSPAFKLQMEPEEND
jgi:hypothetical protein